VSRDAVAAAVQTIAVRTRAARRIAAGSTLVVHTGRHDLACCRTNLHDGDGAAGTAVESVRISGDRVAAAIKAVPAGAGAAGAAGGTLVVHTGRHDLASAGT